MRVSLACDTTTITASEQHCSLTYVLALDFYHVYWDPTDHFQYNVTLFRDDEEMGILGERYVVRVSFAFRRTTNI